MTFTRLTRGDLLAMVAALALLLTMALDWWTTAVGENARDIEENVLPQLNRGDSPTVSQQAAEAAETSEKNAWQSGALIDRVLLALLVASAVLAIFAAWARASGRTLGPPSPSAIATLTGLVACVLLVYRILQPPGLNVAAVVKPGAPLGLLCVGLLTLGVRIATRAEQRPRPEPADEEAEPGFLSSPP